jgi:hypothetical protein
MRGQQATLLESFFGRSVQQNGRNLGAFSLMNRRQCDSTSMAAKQLDET